MKSDEEIFAAQQRVISVFRRRPEAALDTKRARARIDHGLTCTVSEEDRKVIVDMPGPVGGSEMGPTPGFHARAAVSGCVAIGIKMTAIREGLTLRSVNVDVEMDFDDSAVLGMGNRSAAPLETRLTIHIDADVSLEELEAMVGRALASDVYFLALRDPQAVKTNVVKG